jgi:ATP-dependent Zn protease
VSKLSRRCPCGSGEQLETCCKNLLTATKTLEEIIDFHQFMVLHALKNPQQFVHKMRRIAFHEAGHALMRMLFYRDLRRVTIFPDKTGGSFCEGIPQFWKPDDVNVGQHHMEYAAIALAGKTAMALFCLCDACKKEDEAIEALGGGDDEESYASHTAHISDELKQQHSLATTALLQRHRQQLDAIVEALLAHQTLSGSEVFEVMLASGWNPNTDVDPEQFFNEVLGITPEVAAA